MILEIHFNDVPNNLPIANREYIIQNFPLPSKYIDRGVDHYKGVVTFEIGNEVSPRQETWLLQWHNEGIITTWETVNAVPSTTPLPQPELFILEETEQSLTIRISQNFDYISRITVAIYEGTFVKIRNMVSEPYRDASHILLNEQELALIQAGFAYWNKKREALDLGDLDEHPF